MEEKTNLQIMEEEALKVPTLKKKEFDFTGIGMKEMTAMELRYLNNTYKQIAEKIDSNEHTVTDWFRITGKLHTAFDEYTMQMNKKRQANALARAIESDENILTITTNAMRRFGKNLKNEDFAKNISMADFEKAWKIQRIMLGLPTSYVVSEVTADVTVQGESIIEELGLTEEDFKDDKFESTTKKIKQYLDSNPDIQL